MPNKISLEAFATNRKVSYRLNKCKICAIQDPKVLSEINSVLDKRKKGENVVSYNSMILWLNEVHKIVVSKSSIMAHYDYNHYGGKEK